MSRPFPSADLDAWITREPEQEREGDCGGDCGGIAIAHVPCGNPLDFCDNCPAENGRKPKLVFEPIEYTHFCPLCGETYEHIDTCGFVNGG